MIERDVDVVILGSGFAGSLCGTILAKGGKSVAVVDRAAHPRFAIGESSTPVANFVLRDLCVRHQLDALLPLTKFGTWKRQYPQVVCGLKRGFSYFPHRPDAEFIPSQDHENELLVTASSNDELGDTHWLRADVDALFADTLQASGASLFERTELDDIRHEPNGSDAAWELTGRCQDEPLRIRARFLIDASGEAGVLAKQLGIAVSPESLATRSRAVFSHFRDLGSWDEWLAYRDAAVWDHPFCCDDAAQHHLFDGAWMYILRFKNGVTSAGFAIDARRHPRNEEVSPEEEWNEWLDRYPSVRALFEEATIVDPPGEIISTGILPRRAATAVGADWAMLPNTAGFIDPLHSSGIAHSMCGVERLTNCLLSGKSGEALQQQLRDYERAVFAELELADLMVHGCYESFTCFPVFVAFSMLYFAAATTYERQRVAAGSTGNRWFLCADDPEFVRIVREFHSRVVNLCGNSRPSAEEITQFEHDLAEALRPYNHVGLLDPSANNLYRYTAPQES